MKKRGLVALVTLGVVIAIAWSAWTLWPPVLRWRLLQTERRSERVMREYLLGKQDLARAARTLADLWKASMCIADRLLPDGIPEPRPDPEFQALMMRVDERRINVLLDSAAKFTPNGPGWTRYMDGTECSSAA